MPLSKETSRGALLYALRELGRRAGATPAFIASWQVEFSDRSVTVFLDTSRTSRIIFPIDFSKPNRVEPLAQRSPARYCWMRPPERPELSWIDAFIVPFEDRTSHVNEPLFETVETAEIACRADVLTPTLWTLSRAEELAAPALDEHSRFRAADAVLFRSGFGDRPVIDEYGLALEQALAKILPSWKPAPRNFRFMLTHDIDLTGLPRTVRSTLGHLLKRRLPRAFARDTMSYLGVGIPAYLEGVVRIADISRRRGLKSTFFWQASRRSDWDSGYDPGHPLIRKVIENLVADGFEQGIHPGYYSFDSFEKLTEELARLRGVVGNEPIGGRQHWLRWQPRTWLAWEQAGLCYDSSVGFAERVGFRAGTCVPYHPWLIDDDRESPLLEIPLIVMDGTLHCDWGMRLPEKEAFEILRALVTRCRAVGGVFSLLWHNTSAVEEPFVSWYPHVLDLVRGSSDYNWVDDIGIVACPRALEHGSV